MIYFWEYTWKCIAEQFWMLESVTATLVVRDHRVWRSGAGVRSLPVCWSTDGCSVAIYRSRMCGCIYVDCGGSRSGGFAIPATYITTIETIFVKFEENPREKRNTVSYQSHAHHTTPYVEKAWRADAYTHIKKSYTYISAAFLLSDRSYRAKSPAALHRARA